MSSVMAGKDYCSTCQHNTMLLSRRTIADGRVQFVYQCQRCGRAGQALKMNQVGRDRDLPNFDPDIGKRTWQAELTDWRKEHEVYLQTPQWRDLRGRVLARAGRLCEGCRERQATQVHHLTYAHWKAEFLWELVAVCDECHTRFHVSEDEGASG